MIINNSESIYYLECINNAMQLTDYIIIEAEKKRKKSNGENCVSKPEFGQQTYDWKVLFLNRAY